MIQLSVRPVGRETIAKPIRFNAPLFRSLVQRLDTGERCVVLDLGAARTQTVSLFGRYGCRLDIADLIDGVEQLNAEPDPECLQDRAEALLPVPHAEAADAVLCWDILNYLDRPALTALMSRVAARSRPGTLVHMLIVYAETHMPACPGHIVPQEDHSLLDVAVSRGEREAPRYTPCDLTDCLHGYALERAVLLTNGLQEMLFRL